MHTLHLEKIIARNLKPTYSVITLLTLAILAIYFLPALIRMDMYTDDMRQHISWYYSYQDSELFKKDLLKIFYADTFLVIGFKTLYSLGSKLIDPQILGEILAFVLALCGITLAYAIGRQITAGKHLGGIANILFFLFGSIVSINYMEPFAGGLQRSFALPIFLLGIWALLRKDFVILSLSFFLAVLFYPPTFISLGVYSALVLSVQYIKNRRITMGMYLLLTSLAVCFSLLLWSQHQSLNKSLVWTTYSIREALQMFEFYLGGSIPVFFTSWWTYIRNAFPSGLPLALFLLSFISMTFFHKRFGIYRLEAISLVLSAWFCYALAYLIFFKLYEPNRYLIYPFFSFWFLIFPSVFLRTIGWLEKTGFNWTENIKLSRRYFTILFTIVLLVVVSVSGTLVVQRVAKGQGGMIGTAPNEVYKFLHSLPKTTIVAAHPTDADDIPMRSQRSVLVMAKALYPSHKEFYNEMKDRAMAVWAAMYTSDAKTILFLKEKYGADVFLVNRQIYQNDPIKYKPFDLIINKFKASVGDKKPLLLFPPKEAVLYKNGDFLVLDLKKLEKLKNL